MGSTGSEVRVENKDPQQLNPSNGVDDYKGNVLAGTQSLYREFNQEDYKKALTEEKIIFLDFYANWCPICRAEAPEIQKGFDALSTDAIIGFRVNFKDHETDEHETALAKEFDIPYQHTKVILRGGKEVFRSGDQWTQKDFEETIATIL